MGIIKEGMKVNQWQVEKKLGEGGFGEVFRVSKTTAQGKKDYALKTERLDAHTRVLKMDGTVMKLAANAKGLKHIPRCEEAGCFGDVVYVVMTLAWRALDSLRAETPQKKFSMGCAISVGIQCLDAIEELHSIGFLHRGHGYATHLLAGLRYVVVSANIIYAREWRTELSTTGITRTELRFYQQIEITRGAVPWRDIENMVEICMFKERCRYEVGLQHLVGGCPYEFIEILRIIDRCTYFQAPDYKRINGLMRQALASTDSQEFPYDWEPAAKEKIQSVAPSAKAKIQSVAKPK